MKNLTKKQKIIIMLELICIITLAIIFAIIYFQDDNTQTNTSDVTETIDNSNTNIPQYIADLKSQVEKDEADYGNDYKEFTNIGYKRKPDRIIFKSGDKDEFYIFEKNDENFNHLLEVCEDRMFYSSIEDYNLYCFTPDSINTMMTSKENYIIFDYDNENLSEYDDNFQKDLIFRFLENTRLYRLASYLSYFKNATKRDELNKQEFATNTNISGYQYMMSNYLND